MNCYSSAALQRILHRVLHVILIGITIDSVAQTTTITLRPDATTGKDAFLASGTPANNFGNHVELASYGWTCNSNPCYARGLFEFDLSAIPAGSTINNATLSLYAHPAPGNAGGIAMNGTANASLVQRVVQPWNESTVTWNNQPSTVTQNEVILPQSTSSYQDYPNIDVTDLVQDMINNPSASFGFMLRLQSENYYNSMIFASSDYSDTTKHPMLVITYSIGSSDCVTLRPDATTGKDAFLASGTPANNFGNHVELASYGWTCNSNPCYARGLFEFDLSAIPAGSTISNATLSLYAHPAPGNAGGIAMNGTANASLVQRVVQPWNESTVTWNNQPSTVTQNEVILPQSTSSYQDYPNIDVTDLVQDMINNPSTSFGFMLRLQSENYYNSMIFASSDYSDTTKHPMLEVCFLSASSLKDESVPIENVNVYPNPLSDEMTISYLLNENAEVRLDIYNALGQKIYEHAFMKQLAGDQQHFKLNTSDAGCARPGIYFVCLTVNGESITRKLVNTGL